MKTDAGSMRGRDASVIKADVVALKERVKADTALSAMQRKVLLKAAQEVFDDVDSEEAMEKACMKVCQRVFLFVSFGPMLLTMMGHLGEWAGRHEMIIDETPDLSGMRAIVTGGCGSVGGDVSIMLAQRGAHVIAACHALHGEEDGGGGLGPRLPRQANPLHRAFQGRSL